MLSGSSERPPCQNRSEHDRHSSTVYATAKALSAGLFATIVAAWHNALDVRSIQGNAQADALGLTEDIIAQRAVRVTRRCGWAGGILCPENAGRAAEPCVRDTPEADVPPKALISR
jgi:hypothetical protein